MLFTENKKLYFQVFAVSCLVFHINFKCPEFKVNYGGKEFRNTDKLAYMRCISRLSYLFHSINSPWKDDTLRKKSFFLLSINELHWLMKKFSETELALSELNVTSDGQSFLKRSLRASHKQTCNLQIVMHRHNLGMYSQKLSCSEQNTGCCTYSLCHEMAKF